MTPKTLGEMTDAEIGALVRAYRSGKKIEVFNCNDEWLQCDDHPAWDLRFAYRIAPEPIQQAVIPWDILTDDIIAVAMDEDGEWHSYNGQPKPVEDYWAGGDAYFSLRHIKFDRGNEPDWRKTLQVRLGYEVLK